MPGSVFVGCVTSKMLTAPARKGQSHLVLRRELWAQDAASEMHGERLAPDTPVFFLCRCQGPSRRRPGFSNEP